MDGVIFARKMCEVLFVFLAGAGKPYNCSHGNNGQKTGSLKSPNMEREALLRSLAFISSCVDIEVVTDASTSVKKLLCKCSWNRHVHINMDTIVVADDYPEVNLSYDVRHK